VNRSKDLHVTLSLRSGALLGAGITALFLTSCAADDTVDGAAEAADVEGWEAPDGLEGTLTVYSVNPQELADELAAAFEAHTGVAVEKFDGPTGEVTARLDAEWDNPQADVVYLASWAPAAAYAEEGLLEAYAPEGSAEVYEDWADPEDRFTGRDGSALTLVVNTDNAPASPSDWSDLAEPEWQDEVTMPDPRESGTARDLIAAMALDLGEEETWALFDDLFANGLVVEGANGPALDSVLAGSYAAVLGGVDYSAYSAMDDGEPVEVILPDSGTTVTPRPVFIPADAPNPQAAQAFLDFLFSEEGQAISARHNMIPAREDADVAEGTRDYAEVEQLEFDWDEIGEQGDEVLDEFVERYL
jgi:iron(III) transport system substrate-binding protein